MNIHCNGKQYFFSDEEPETQSCSVDEEPVLPALSAKESLALLF